MKKTLFLAIIILLLSSCKKDEFAPVNISIPDSTYFVKLIHKTDSAFCLYPYAYLILDASYIKNNASLKWLPDGDTSAFRKIYDPGDYQLIYNIISPSQLDADTISFHVEHCDLPDDLTTPLVYVPNAFSPNYDNVADNFYPFPNSLVYSIYFQIRDAEGLILYEEKKGDHIYLEGWDGKYKGSYMPQGMYLYYINYSTINTENNIMTGSFELIR